ncbi:hypothetical protein B0H66DRAFT_596712 [Apodospora peruviana]|uniref:Uncharacterized protein n=1 Tax=Apodospora peruviana TaxID=516989 RepID=A0AAE0IQ62_9PEZI|nr:hypothetical protein B0H66DRAFT_596712 [Apodospora peruviana]
MPIPPQSQYFINRYDFEEPTSRDEPPPDLHDKSKDELIRMVEALRSMVKGYEEELEAELQAKLTQARLLNTIEMHLDILPGSSESFHQILSLDHATTWMRKYGPDERLLVGVNSTQREVTSRRLKEMMRHCQLCDTSTACRHVLSARPTEITPDPRQLLTLRQVSLGLPVQEYLDSFLHIPSSDEIEYWRRMDDDLLAFLNNPDISNDEYNRITFLTAYFRGQLSKNFEHARVSVISKIQREGHDRKDKKECTNVSQSRYRKMANTIKRISLNAPPLRSNTSLVTADEMALRPTRIPRPANSSRKLRPPVSSSDSSSVVSNPNDNNIQQKESAQEHQYYHQWFLAATIRLDIITSEQPV